ncbi:MAG: hypothetical protein K6C34_03125 [Alphaproteobacteria bacterium]|nr:hypothetical protein [Alphaproteobacteria bacterium]
MKKVLYLSAAATLLASGIVTNACATYSTGGYDGKFTNTSSSIDGRGALLGEVIQYPDYCGPSASTHNTGLEVKINAETVESFDREQFYGQGILTFLGEYKSFKDYFSTKVPAIKFDVSKIYQMDPSLFFEISNALQQLIKSNSDEVAVVMKGADFFSAALYCEIIKNGCVQALNISSPDDKPISESFNFSGICYSNITCLQVNGAITNDHLKQITGLLTDKLEPLEELGIRVPKDISSFEPGVLKNFFNAIGESQLKRLCLSNIISKMPGYSDRLDELITSVVKIGGRLEYLALPGNNLGRGGRIANLLLSPYSLRFLDLSENPLHYQILEFYHQNLQENNTLAYINLGYSPLAKKIVAEWKNRTLGSYADEASVTEAGRSTFQINIRYMDSNISPISQITQILKSYSAGTLRTEINVTTGIGAFYSISLDKLEDILNGETEDIRLKAVDYFEMLVPSDLINSLREKIEGEK